MAARSYIDKTGRRRCWWVASAAEEFVPYHDREWGFPVQDDRRLFEKLCLEGFQSGLSWRTILNKRENFRAGFAGFDIARVSRFTARDRNRLLKDAGIVRHRGKIEATINNSARALEVIDEFGSLAAYVWSYEPLADSRPKKMTCSAVMKLTTCPESVQMSKDLKRRGFKFVGPTTVYAFMQAMGLVNDHTHDCCVRDEAERARKRFRRPR